MEEVDERTRVIQYVEKELRGENLWTKLWSLLYHSFVFGASILSALAALTLQLKSISWESAVRADIAAGLSAIASVIGVMSVSGGFGQKWRANRVTKGTLEEIQIRLLDPGCDLQKIRTDLQEMKRQHHSAIIAGDQAQKK